MRGNSQLILLLIIFGMSAISWIIGKLREQAAVKKMQDELKRRQEEEMRTGRAPDAAQPAQAKSELDQLRELALKRQEQLQQMRQAQRAKASEQPSQAAQARGMGIPFPTVPSTKKSGGPGIPRVEPAARLQRAPALPVPQPPGEPPGQRTRPATQKRLPGTPGRATVPPEIVAPLPAPVVPRRRTQAAVDSDPVIRAGARATRAESDPLSTDSGRRAAPVGLAALLGAATRPGANRREALRRAVVMAEIFGPPRSIRSQQ